MAVEEHGHGVRRIETGRSGHRVLKTKENKWTDHNKPHLGRSESILVALRARPVILQVPNRLDIDNDQPAGCSTLSLLCRLNHMATRLARR